LTNRITLTHRIFSAFVRSFEFTVSLFGKGFYWKFMPRLLEAVNLTYVVEAKGKRIKIHCGGEVSRFRAQTLLTKEPGTLAWIDQFSDGDVMLDIGANIGVYTLYAAVTKGLRVIAVEPSAANFNNLSRNIQLNGIGDLVYPFCIAASDRQNVAKLFMHSGGLVAGGSGSIFGSDILDDDSKMDVRGVQHAMGFSMDGLIDMFGLPFPTQIKMDVIGTQDRVIRGALGLLRDLRVKSAMLEIPPRQEAKSREIFDHMGEAGFVPDARFKNSDIEFFFRRPNSD
jgi:FkbM family methyltransferase